MSALPGRQRAGWWPWPRATAQDAAPGRRGARSRTRIRRSGRARLDEAAMREALEPVRAALLRRAHERADEIMTRARGQAAGHVSQARRAAAEQVAAAEQAGRAQAGPLAAAVASRGRRDARSLLLGAQREAVEELRARVRAEVAGLRAEPGYPAMLERLSATARRLAGPEAAVAEDPAGGVLARGPGVVVDCSLPRLADAAVDDLGAEVDQLWAPEGGGPQGDRS